MIILKLGLRLAGNTVYSFKQNIALSSSIQSNLLYFYLSDLHGAPVLICPIPRPTARSVIVDIFSLARTVRDD